MNDSRHPIQSDCNIPVESKYVVFRAPNSSSYNFEKNRDMNINPISTYRVDISYQM